MCVAARKKTMKAPLFGSRIECDNAEYEDVLCTVGPPCLSFPVLVGCPAKYLVHLQVTPVVDTASENKRSF